MSSLFPTAKGPSAPFSSTVFLENSNESQMTEKEYFFSDIVHQSDIINYLRKNVGFALAHDIATDIMCKVLTDTQHMGANRMRLDFMRYVPEYEKILVHHFPFFKRSPITSTIALDFGVWLVESLMPAKIAFLTNLSHTQAMRNQQLPIIVDVSEAIASYFPTGKAHPYLNFIARDIFNMVTECDVLKYGQTEDWRKTLACLVRGRLSEFIVPSDDLEAATYTAVEVLLHVRHRAEQPPMPLSEQETLQTELDAWTK